MGDAPNEQNVEFKKPSGEPMHMRTMIAQDEAKSNPLNSQQNQNYVAQKLMAYRQSIIDKYGQSKVPTPVPQSMEKSETP